MGRKHVTLLMDRKLNCQAETKYRSRDRLRYLVVQILASMLSV
jgi:hypothetical protein